jgi:hypothetical protein
MFDGEAEVLTPFRHEALLDLDSSMPFSQA